MRTELVVRLARSRAQLALAHLLLIAENHLGDEFHMPNPFIGELSLTRVNLRNFRLISQLSGAIGQFANTHDELSPPEKAR